MVTKAPSKLLVKLGYMAAVFLGTLLSVFPPAGSFFSWWEYHTLHWMLTLFGLGLFWFIFDQKKLMLASFAACAVLCLHLDQQPRSNLKPRTSGVNPLVKVAHFNLSLNGDSLNSVIQLVLHTGADLISVQENLTTSDQEQIYKILTLCGYLHSEKVETGQNYRVTLFSRLPFARIRPTAHRHRQSLNGILMLPFGTNQYPIHFICVSLKTAENRSDLLLLEEELQTMARQVQGVKGPLLVFGHYGLVSWSREMRSFQLRAGLRDSRRRLTPSQPHGFFSIWSLPVDHLFFNKHLRCVNFVEISSPRDNHLGVVGTFELVKQTVFNDQAPSKEL